jgi:hypothetical protein
MTRGGDLYLGRLLFSYTAFMQKGYNVKDKSTYEV